MTDGTMPCYFCAISTCICGTDSGAYNDWQFTHKSHTKWHTLSLSFDASSATTNHHIQQHTNPQLLTPIRTTIHNKLLCWFLKNKPIINIIPEKININQHRININRLKISVFFWIKPFV